MYSKIEGEETERDRISKEIHDGVGAKLSGLTLHLESVSEQKNYEQLPSLINQIRESYDELRSISHGIYMPFIEENTLVELTRNLLSNAAIQLNLKIVFIVFPENQALGFEQRAAINIYRIVQELISNITKHAQARKAEIHFTKTDNHFFLSVEDDGIGFNTKNANQGIGLKNVQDRVEMMGGTINVDSRIGHGTSIQIDFEGSDLFTTNG